MDASFKRRADTLEAVGDELAWLVPRMNELVDDSVPESEDEADEAVGVDAMEDDKFELRLDVM
jgi:hypothetical protein